MANVLELAAVFMVENHRANEAIDNITKEAKKAEKGFDNMAGEGEKSESRLGKAFAKIGSAAAVVGKTVATGLAAGATAMTGLAVKAMNLGGELEQNMGGSEAVFKDYAESMQETGKKAFSNMGLATSDFLATANKMGALFQGSGFSIKESSEMSASAMQRAADVASIMGIDTASAMEAVAGAAKGNFTMMDNLGVSMNDTAIKAYALEKGIKTAGKEMTQQEKIGVAMQMFMDKTAYAAGNYAKENETLAGSLTTAKSALKNFLDGSGDVDGLVNSLSGLAEIVIKNMEEILPRLTDGMSNLVQKLIPKIPPLISKLLPPIITGATTIINGLVTALPGLISAIAGALPQIVTALVGILVMLADSLPQIIQPIVDALPGLIPVVVDGLVQMLLALMNNVMSIVQPIIDALPNIIKSVMDAVIAALPQLVAGLIDLVIGIVKALPQIIKTLINAIPTIISSLIIAIIDALPQLVEGLILLVFEIVKALPQIIFALVTAAPTIIFKILESLSTALPHIFEKGKEILQGLWNGISKAIPDLWNNVKNFIGELPGKLLEVLGRIKDVGKNIVEGLWNGIKDMGKWILDKIKGFGSSILDGIKGVFGIHSPSTETAYFGEMLSRGLGEGMVNAMGALSGDIKKVKDGVIGQFDGMKADIGLGVNLDHVSGRTGIAATRRSVASTAAEILSRKTAPVASSGGFAATLAGTTTGTGTATEAAWSGLEPILVKIEHFHNHRAQDIKDLAREIMQEAENERRRRQEVFA